MCTCAIASRLVGRERARARGVNELGPGGGLFYFFYLSTGGKSADEDPGYGGGGGGGGTRKKRLIAHCDNSNSNSYNNNTITSGRVGLPGEGHVKRPYTRKHVRILRVRFVRV